MQDSSKVAVINFLKRWTPQTILDAPCGNGWLASLLPYSADIDGVDLYVAPSVGYRRVLKGDLDEGLAPDLPLYDAILCCEGLDQLGNPMLFLMSARRHLAPGGFILITLPNTWYPESRLLYLVRGFFPSYRYHPERFAPQNFIQKIPWSFPQLYLFLKLAGFGEIELQAEQLSQPKHLWEWLIALPQAFYCRSRQREASSEKERDFWSKAGSPGSRLGRHLIVTARVG